MNELDKIFRSKLENRTEEFSSQSWDKIQSRLIQQKTKPKQFPWLWMSLFSMVLIGGVYLFVSSPDDNRLAQSQSATENISKNDKQAPALIEESSLTAAPVTEDTSNEVIVDKFAAPSVTSTLEAGNTSKVKTTELEERTQSITKENQQRINATQNSSELNTEIFAVREIEGDQQLIEVNNGSSTSKANTSTEVTKEDIELEKNNTISESRIFDIRPLRTIGVSTFSKLQSIEKQDHVELSPAMLEEFRQDCPSFVTDRTGVYLDFYLSHELPFSSLNAKDETLNSYRVLRAETEGPSYSFSAGARLTLMLPNGLGLKTGFNYSQVNEKFSYIDPESIMRKQVITITTVDGMEVRDTNFIEIPGTREIVSTNKYRSFDIPLLLSYEWDVRERTYMTVNGGIYLNLLFKESGKILDSSGEVIDIAGNGGDQLAIFKNNIGLSLFGSVGLHYRWNSSIDFILEPNARLLVKSATVDGYPLEHKWITAGLITGLRYNF